GGPDAEAREALRDALRIRYNGAPAPFLNYTAPPAAFAAGFALLLRANLRPSLSLCLCHALPSGCADPATLDERLERPCQAAASGWQLVYVLFVSSLSPFPNLRLR